MTPTPTSPSAGLAEPFHRATATPRPVEPRTRPPSQPAAEPADGPTDEEVLERFHAHWHTLLVIIPVVGFGAVIETAALMSGGLGGQTGLLVRLAVWGFVAVFSASLVLRWLTTVYRLTTRSLVRSSGILKRVSLEIPLTEVASVSCSQTIFERILRFGDLKVETAGDSDSVLTDIPRPKQFKQRLSAAAHEASQRERQGSPGTAFSIDQVADGIIDAASRSRRGAPRPDTLADVAAQRARAWQLVARLGGLVEAGLLTEQQFERAVEELTGA